MVLLLKHCGFALFTLDLSGNTRHQAACGNITRHDGSSCDQRSLANGDSVENNGSDPNLSLIHI